MSTPIRPELSVQNEYYLERHRYYELRHFCLQYPLWKQLYSELDGYGEHDLKKKSCTQRPNTSSPVEECVKKRAFYSDRIEMVEKSAQEASPDLANYLIKAVTEDLNYDYLKTVMDIPCCRSVYYKTYRRFFFLLDKARK